MGLDEYLKRLHDSTRRVAPTQKELSRLDQKLRELDLGIELFLMRSPFCIEPETRKAWVVGYARLPGKGWRLAVRPVQLGQRQTKWTNQVNQPTYAGPPQPLGKAPPPVQIGATRLLPELIEQLRREVHTAVRTMQWSRLLPDAMLKSRRSPNRGPVSRKASSDGR